MEDFDCVNYVITHKPYPVAQDEMYRKLCVGDYQDDISASEHDGQNIAEYNGRLNELTGLYWIWMNTVNKYVGLSHYRRYFENCGHKLDRIGVEDLLVADGYDIILSRKTELPWSLEENISRTVGKEYSDAMKDSLIKAMKKRRPKSVETFRKVLAGNRLYTCNMFVTRREILDQYCKWLFSFLLEATDKVDFSQAAGYAKRTAGYYGEVLLTVWMEMHPELNVYEMPVVRIG